MSYSHMFYGLDLKKLKAIYGSKDDRLSGAVLKARAQDFKDNDEFFEDEIEGGDFPNSEQALREIVAGSIGQHDGAEAMFGYVLKILCEHVGQRIGNDDVAAVGEHPYASQLVASGPPVPIPVNKEDFPEIGFLALSQIPDEIKRIDEAPKRARRNLVLSVLGLLTGGKAGRQMADNELAEDMAAYRKTLNDALEKKLDIVSFRH
jgi:hypothetical protein